MSSGKREWANLSIREKRHYFVSEGAVGILLMFPLFGGIAGIIVTDDPSQFHFDWTIGFLGLLISLASVGVLWFGKWFKVRESLKREH